MATMKVSAPPQATHSTMIRPSPHDNGTSLIARAEALNAFMKMQPAADQARNAAAGNATGTAPNTTRSMQPAAPAEDPSGCFCFSTSSTKRPNTAGKTSPQAGPRPQREYYPDNLSVQPKPHPWDNRMEWLITACVDFLEAQGLHERNLFAVSAVEDLVRAMTVPLGSPLPKTTDPHVAAGVIKAKIRHADEPLVSKTCLRKYIDAQASEGGDGKAKGQKKAAQGAPKDSEKGTGSAPGTPKTPKTSRARTFRQTFLASTIDDMEELHGARRSYILARFMRLLGRVSANIEASKMNAHCLAKCVAPSMLHWDPNSGFALLMLGKITAYVMAMIEDARVFDEHLCQKIDDLQTRGGW